MSSSVGIIDTSLSRRKSRTDDFDANVWFKSIIFLLLNYYVAQKFFDFIFLKKKGENIVDKLKLGDVITILDIIKKHYNIPYTVKLTHDISINDVISKIFTTLIDYYFSRKSEGLSFVLDELIKTYNKKLLISNENFLNSLTRFKRKGDLPYFELYMIEFLKLMGANVVELVYFEDKRIYSELHNYYDYTNNPTISDKMKEIITDDNLSITIKTKLDDYDKDKNISVSNPKIKSERKQLLTGKQKTLDFIVLVHHKYNKKLTKYYDELIKVENKFVQRNDKMNIGNNLNMIHYDDKDFTDETMITIHRTNYSERTNKQFKLVACLLRNNNYKENTKTILGFIDCYNAKEVFTNDVDNTTSYFIAIKWFLDEQYISEQLDKKKGKEKNQKFNWLKVEQNTDTDTYKFSFTNKEIIINENGFDYKFNFATGDKLLLYHNIHKQYYKTREPNYDLIKDLETKEIERLNIDIAESSASTASPNSLNVHDQED